MYLDKSESYKITNVLPFLKNIKMMDIIPLSNASNQIVNVITSNNKQFEISINTFYDNKSYISIKYEDKYLVSKAGMKYFINYLLLSNDSNEVMYIFPINIYDIKNDINYLDINKNIRLYYAIMDFTNEAI